MARNSMYSGLVAEAPQVAKTYDSLASEGPLDGKTRRLVRLGAAAALALEGAVRHHAHKAVHEGVPLDELRHAVALALTIAGQDAIHAVRWTEEAIACNGKGPTYGICIPIRYKYGGKIESQRLRAELDRFKSILANPKTSVQDLKTTAPILR